MSEEKVSAKKDLISIQESVRGVQNNNSASPPDSKNHQDITKKLSYNEQPTEPQAFEKFVLEPFNMNEPTFWSFMQTYLSSKIESRQAQSFYDFDILQAKQTVGYDRHYVKLTAPNSKETQGVAIFNVDHTAVGEYRAFIRHLSTVDTSKLQKAVEQVVDHIWRTVYCTHIRVELYHITDETGKMQADPDVKNAFSKIGFKWKTLSNDPSTGKRA